MIGLKSSRKPSFSPCDLCPRNSPARLVTFSQSYLGCYLTTQDRCPDNELENIRHFWYFFCNFLSFLQWKCFKICTCEDIDVTILIPYFLKILWSNFLFNVTKWYFLTIFFEIELERYILCLEPYKLLKNSPNETQDICVHFWAFLRIWRHTFPELSINFPPK